MLKPPGESNEAIVAEVEWRASELAGSYLSKEYDSFVICCSGGIQVNRSFAVMGVKYPDREEPKKPEKRSKGASGEDPVAKKKESFFYGYRVFEGYSEDSVSETGPPAAKGSLGEER